MSLLINLVFSTLLLSHTLAASFHDPKQPKELAHLDEPTLWAKDYEALPWYDLAKNEFFPRHSFLTSDSQEAIAKDSKPTPTGTHPTNTLPNRRLLVRDQSTFTCPTSVQCVDGGCCELGDYCAIKDGILGCCPIGSECDAGPIPGCQTSCFGSCCDEIGGGQSAATCSPAPGDQGQASGVCKAYAPPQVTGGATGRGVPPPPADRCNESQEFSCGQSCCPLNAGIICDNTTIPGTPFCNTPIGVCPPDPVGQRVVEPYDQFAKGVDASAAATASSACLATTNTEAFATRVYASSGLANGATPEPFTGSNGVTTVVPAPAPAAKMTFVSDVPESVKPYFVEVPVMKVPNPNFFP